MIDLNSSQVSKTVDNVNAADANKTAVSDDFMDGLSFDDLMADYEGNAGSGEGGGDLSGFGISSDSGDSGFGGSLGGFGNDMGGFGGGLNIGGQLGNNMQQPAAPPKPTLGDTITEGSIQAVKATGNVFKSFTKSLKGITFDDFAALSMDFIVWGGVITVLAIIFAIAGAFGNKLLAGFAKLLLPTGGIPLSAGFIGLAISGFGLLNKNEPTTTLSSVDDMECKIDDKLLSTDEFDSEYDILLNSIDFGDDAGGDDLGFDDLESSSDSSNSSDDFWGNSGSTSNDDFWGNDSSSSSDNSSSDGFDTNKALDNIDSRSLKIDREYLVENFTNLLPTNSTGFDEVHDVDSNTFNTVAALTKSAIAATLNVETEEVKQNVTAITETKFVYNITVERKKFSTNKLQMLETEMMNFFKAGESDIGTVATARIAGSDIIITLTKGCTDAITVRDCMACEETKAFFKKEGNLLPYIAGITATGEVKLVKGEDCASILTAGEARSGKSWLLASTVLQLAMYNPPSRVQFLLVDPKSTPLFRALSVLPHTIGLKAAAPETGENIDVVAILQYIVEVEAPRRVALLKKENNGVKDFDSIKAFAKAGLPGMPYLYIMIDEYLTVYDNAKQEGKNKQLDGYLRTIVSNYPYIGIFPWIIAHRAQPAVDKTARQLFHMKMAIKANTEVVGEVTGDTNFSRPLTKPGDTALSYGELTGNSAIFIRSATVATGTNPKYDDADDELKDNIYSVAKAWYKVGVEIPKIDYGMLAEKNVDFIREQLNLDDDTVVKLKSTANSTINNVAREIQIASSTGDFGLLPANAFAVEHRQESNSLNDLLGNDFDSNLVGVKPAKHEEPVLTDEDEELMSRWHDAIDSADSDNEEVSEEGWLDESNIFDE